MKKKVSEELPVGAVAREMNEKMRTLKNFHNNGTRLSEQSSHSTYMKIMQLKL